MKEYHAQKTFDGLSKNGLFLVCADGDVRNVMTIGWGFCGRMWRKEVFLAPVRHSRFSHDIIEKSGFFNVCVPNEGEMKSELAFCGTKSGRDTDKFSALNLQTGEAHKTPCPILTGCSVIYECRVVYVQPLDGAAIGQYKLDHLYADEDYHTMFYGEILDCYELSK